MNTDITVEGTQSTPQIPTTINKDVVKGPKLEGKFCLQVLNVLMYFIRRPVCNPLCIVKIELNQLSLKGMLCTISSACRYFSIFCY